MRGNSGGICKKVVEARQQDLEHDASIVLVRKYFPYINYDSMSFEEQIILRVDALYLEQRELKNLAELLSRLLGG